MSLPPTLARYHRKLTDPAREAKMRAGTQRYLTALYQAMRRRFLWKLQSYSVNPDFPDSIASGELRDSLGVKSSAVKSGFKATVFTTAKHFNFVDSGNSEEATDPTRTRIKKWLEDRFKVSAGTAEDAVIDHPVPGYFSTIRYGSLVNLVQRIVQDRLSSEYYQGLDLYKVIGETTTKPGGEDAFYGMLDWWRSFYTMAPAA